MSILTQQTINKILHNNLEDPFAVLGMHWEKQGVSIRVFSTLAVSIDIINVLSGTTAGTMNRVHADGVFELALPEAKEFFSYELRQTLHDSRVICKRDPYSFLPIMPDMARYLFNEGNNYRIFDDLGSHVRDIDGVRGCVFAVWAPNAKRVSLVGDFNSWDGRCHPMRSLGSSGIWELFVPGLDNGTVYKYEIKKPGNDHLVLKTDPYGYYQDPPPNHASIVFDVDGFTWEDNG
jgi:1,4-alpha-glucan branching enzyme